ncbi:MAG: PorP/SprF family type IX secretion system membrane protein [Flavobacteriaceae bacterium]
MRIKLTILLFIGVIFNSLGQHEFQFTQYNLIPAIYNPAATGERNSSTINLNHREQWMGLEGAPSQTFLNFESSNQEQKLGYGISFIQEQIGPVNDLTVNANISYRLKLSEHDFLAIGLKGTVEFWNLDLFDINQYQNDPVLYGDDTNQTYFNIGAGLWYQRKGLTFGFSIPYFIKHDYSGTGQDASIQEEMHLYYNLAYDFKLADYLSMTPSILVRQIQDRPTTTDFWLTGDIYNNFKLGLMYRTSNAMGIMAGIQATKSIYIGYSYDQETTDVNATNRGSHEFALRFDFAKSKQN